MELNNKQIDYENQIEANLLEEYTKMIKSHIKKINQKITHYILSKDKSIEKHQIENLLDKYFNTDLEYSGLNSINTLTEELNEKQSIVMEHINIFPNAKTSTFELYKDVIKKILQKDQTNQNKWFNDLIYDFKHDFPKEILSIIKKNKSKTSEEQTILLNDIDNYLKELLDEYQQTFSNDYQELLKSYIDKKLSQLKLFQDKQKLTLEEKKSLIFKYRDIIRLSNFELKDYNGILYIKDKETGLTYDINIDDKYLKCSNSKIKFLYSKTKNQIGYINNEKKLRIILHEGKNKETKLPQTFISIMTKKETENQNQFEEIISFTKVSIENENNTNYQTSFIYQFYYNKELVTDPKLLNYIIKKIKIDAPGIYNNIVNDPDLKTTISKHIEEDNKIASEANNKPDEKSETETESEKKAKTK